MAVADVPGAPPAAWRGPNEIEHQVNVSNVFGVGPNLGAHDPCRLVARIKMTWPGAYDATVETFVILPLISGRGLYAR